MGLHRLAGGLSPRCSVMGTPCRSRGINCRAWGAACDFGREMEEAQSEHGGAGGGGGLQQRCSQRAGQHFPVYALIRRYLTG